MHSHDRHASQNTCTVYKSLYMLIGPCVTVQRSRRSVETAGCSHGRLATNVSW